MLGNLVDTIAIFRLFVNVSQSSVSLARVLQIKRFVRTATQEAFFTLRKATTKWIGLKPGDDVIIVDLLCLSFVTNTSKML